MTKKGIALRSIVEEMKKWELIVIRLNLHNLLLIFFYK